MGPRDLRLGHCFSSHLGSHLRSAQWRSKDRNPMRNSASFRVGEPWESTQPHESMPEQWEFGNLVSWRDRDSAGVMSQELGRDLDFSKGTGGWDRDGPLGWGGGLLGLLVSRPNQGQRWVECKLLS